MSDARTPGAWLFDVYGVMVEICSDLPTLAGDLAEDFAHFEVAALSRAADILLVLHSSAPPFFFFETESS